MKKVLHLLLVGLTILATSCQTELREEIDSLKEQVSALKIAQNAFNNKVFVQTIDKIGDEYSILFSDGSSIKITNGRDGKDGNTIIKSITVNDTNVVFNLSDGTSFSIPLFSAISVTFDKNDSIAVPDSEISIGYKVTSNLLPVTVETVSSSDIKSTCVASGDGLSGIIKIQFSSKIDEYSKVVMLISNGEKMIMYSFHFEQANIIISEGNSLEFGAKGGTEELNLLSNLGFKIIIPDEAKNWLSASQTKALSEHVVAITVSENTTYEDRVAIIKLKGIDYNISCQISVTQHAAQGFVFAKAESIMKKEGGPLYIDVRANEQFSFNIPSDCKWIKTISTKTMETTTSSFYVEPNSNAKSRRAEILFSSESGLKRKYSVSQLGHDSRCISITHNSKSFSISDVGTQYPKIPQNAVIFWGDGNDEKYYPEISHAYSDNNDHTIEIVGDSLETIKLYSIAGLKVIDVSQLAYN